MRFILGLLHTAKTSEKDNPNWTQGQEMEISKVSLSRKEAEQISCSHLSSLHKATAVGSDGCSSNAYVQTSSQPLLSGHSDSPFQEDRSHLEEPSESSHGVPHSMDEEMALLLRDFPHELDDGGVCDHPVAQPLRRLSDPCHGNADPQVASVSKGRSLSVSSRTDLYHVREVSKDTPGQRSVCQDGEDLSGSQPRCAIQPGSLILPSPSHHSQPSLLPTSGHRSPEMARLESLPYHSTTAFPSLQDTAGPCHADNPLVRTCVGPVPCCHGELKERFLIVNETNTFPAGTDSLKLAQLPQHYGKPGMDGVACISLNSFNSMVNDAPMCRICHEGPLPGNDLIAPCRCAGSLSYQHRKCLEQWLQTTGRSACELCHFQFATERKGQAFSEWITQPERTRDRRNILTDCGCFALLTPLVCISAWLCLNGAYHYLNVYQGRGLEGLGLVVLATILILIYLFWSLMSLRYHCVVWKRWKQEHESIHVVMAMPGCGQNHTKSQLQSLLLPLHPVKMDLPISLKSPTPPSTPSLPT
ncbi:uncharacterized protein [Diadema antillarum]|uniref:uncharacterized protein n=1 Tax=Diadema antillarum TaxID=105358 RepID=UPI003A864FF7